MSKAVQGWARPAPDFAASQSAYAFYNPAHEKNILTCREVASKAL
jgi:hypothetical protein